eukprot:GILI01035775.1.p1 GENE.GILI01035775.1~~GILI01035775.1.p1  ORF type:complete len:252 (+),score=45.46 GILI01035775.1:43-756(+)
MQYSDDSSACTSDAEEEKGRRIQKTKPEVGVKEKGPNDSILDFSEDEDGDDGGDRKRQRTEKGTRRGGFREESDSDSDGELADEELSAGTSEPAPQTSLCDLLAKLVTYLHVNESVAEAYARNVEAQAASPLAQPVAHIISSLAKQLLAEHKVPAMAKDRADLVNLYYATPDAPPLPTAYAVEWNHNKGKLFGPYTAAQMNGWAGKNIFKQKKATTRNINDKRPAEWVDATTIETYL